MTTDPKANEPEVALIASAVSGDTSALERLLLTNYRRLAARISRKIPSDLAGVIAAEDVLQETFTEVFRSIGTFEPRGKEAFYGWLGTVAEHRLMDMAKAQRAAKRGGGRKAVQRHHDPEASSVLNLLDWAANHEHTPSRSVARHEGTAAIRLALAGLKEEYREALELRYLQSLPVAEVARRMGRTDRAVQMLCNRGLKRLKVAMGRASAYLSRKA